MKYITLFLWLLFGSLSVAQTLTCPPPSKTDGLVLGVQATADGNFLALVKQGKGWVVQERGTDGGVLRNAPLELAYEKEELAPLFLLRTTDGIAVVADGRDGKVYNEWTALFALDPTTLAPGKAQLVLHGKPGAHNRLYDLRPGGAVSPNGKHVVVWRANTYTWYKDQRTYTLQSFDAEFNTVHRWTVTYPDGPGDRFEQVAIDNKGEVYVLAARDEQPGARKEYGAPTGARTDFELLIHVPGTDAAITTALDFSEPVGDVAIDLGLEGAVRCHGVLQEEKGGNVFTCTLDKNEARKGRFALKDWRQAAVRMQAPSIKGFTDADLETRWQPRMDLPGGGSLIVAQYEQQTNSNVGSFWAYYDMDLLVVRIAPDGTIGAVRLPSYQASSFNELVEPFVTVAPDGMVHLLTNELEQNLEPGGQLDWHRPENYSGVLVHWTVDANMVATRNVVEGAWEKKESRGVHAAVPLSDGRVLLPITSGAVPSMPLAKRLCILEW